MYHFLNLTNGIEALPDLKKLGSENISFIRIQSSWIERGLWVDILRELDHHFLMMLSLDKPVYVYDFGAKKNFSKTLRIGFPFIKFVLEKEWLGKSSKVIHYNHAGNPVNHSYLESQFENIYLDIFYLSMRKTPIPFLGR
jgi:hypothetical protein